MNFFSGNQKSRIVQDALKGEISEMGDTIVIVEHLVLQYFLVLYSQAPSPLVEPSWRPSAIVARSARSSLTQATRAWNMFSYDVQHFFSDRCRGHKPESHPVGLSTLSECQSGQTGQRCISPHHSEQQFAIVVAPEIKSEVRITANERMFMPLHSLPDWEAH